MLRFWNLRLPVLTWLHVLNCYYELYFFFNVEGQGPNKEKLIWVSLLTNKVSNSSIKSWYNQFGHSSYTINSIVPTLPYSTSLSVHRLAFLNMCFILKSSMLLLTYRILQIRFSHDLAYYVPYLLLLPQLCYPLELQFKCIVCPE